MKKLALITGTFLAALAFLLLGLATAQRRWDFVRGSDACHNDERLCPDIGQPWLVLSRRTSHNYSWHAAIQRLSAQLQSMPWENASEALKDFRRFTA